MFYLSLVWRYLIGSRRFFSLTTVISVVGIAVGVGCMIVAMAAFSGFETTLKSSIIDASGHVAVYSNQPESDPPAIARDIKSAYPQLVSLSPFLVLKAVVTGNGRIAFSQILGLDRKTHASVMEIEKRLVKGKLSFKKVNGRPAALIGTGMAKNFNLDIGDELTVVLPNPSRVNASGFDPIVRRFTVTGVLDLGKHDYNERIVFSDLHTVQAFGKLSGKISGFRIKLNDSNESRNAVLAINKKLGSHFFVSDWYDINSNLFQAIAVEKGVLFFVLLILIIAAAFNVAASIFIAVRQRYAQIGLLKTLGATKRKIVQLFVLHGLVVAAVGTILGLILGFVLCFVFEGLQGTFQLIPADVYKLDRINLDVRFTDIVAIFCATYFICFLSSLWPALYGAKLAPVEGLRYE